MGPFTDDDGEGAGEQAGARYGARESLELAFVRALQALPPRQRAALLLRDVIGFTAPEVAEILDVLPASAQRLVWLARRALDARLPPADQQAILHALGEDRVKALAARYAAAWERGDPDALVTLVTEDALLTLPPRPSRYRGHDAIGLYLARGPLAAASRWQLAATRANGQLAFLAYAWQADRTVCLPHALHVLTLARDGRIAEIAAFLDAETLRWFGRR